MNAHLCRMSLVILLSFGSFKLGIGKNYKASSSARAPTTAEYAKETTMLPTNSALTTNVYVTTNSQVTTSQAARDTRSVKTEEKPTGDKVVMTSTTIAASRPTVSGNSALHYDVSNNTLQIQIELRTRTKLFIWNWEERSKITIFHVNGSDVDVSDRTKDDVCFQTCGVETPTMPPSPPAGQTADHNVTVTTVAIAVVVTFLVTAFLFSITLFVLYRRKHCVCRRGRAHAPLTEKLPKREDKFHIALHDVAENEKRSAKVGFENLAFSESTPSEQKVKSGQVYEVGNNIPARISAGARNDDDATYFYAGYITTSRSKHDDSKNEQYAYEGLCAATPIEKPVASQGDYAMYDDTHRKGVNSGDDQKVENVTDSDVYALYDDSHRTLSMAPPSGQSDDDVYALYDDSHRTMSAAPATEMNPVAEDNADFAIYVNTHQLTEYCGNDSNDYALYDDAYRQGETQSDINRRRSQSSCAGDRESNIYGSHADFVRTASNKKSPSENEQLEVEENTKLEDEGELYLNLYSN